MPDGNKEYKSDVFSMLMEEPENALSLYNAVNNSSYSDPSEVEMFKLEKGVSLSIRNDASFILDAQLSVYEHQSTVCPNMPVRSLIYYTNMAEKLIRDRDKNIYGRGLVKLPTPRFAVFYNGEEEQPEVQELKLSDAFEFKMDTPELDLTCRVYNINKGKNKTLLEKCPVLKEYMIFVDYVRDFYRENDYNNLDVAIGSAIDRCIDENVLKDFLKNNRSEVTKVTKLDYTFDRQITLERKDARIQGLEEGRTQGLEEGRTQGLEEGRIQGLKALIGILKENYNNPADICEKIRSNPGYENITEEIVKKYL